MTLFTNRLFDYNNIDFGKFYQKVRNFQLLNTVNIAINALVLKGLFKNKFCCNNLWGQILLYICHK